MTVGNEAGIVVTAEVSGEGVFEIKSVIQE